MPLQYGLCDRAGIDPDPDGHARISAGLRDGADMGFAADVAGIDSDFIRARVHARQGESVVEMDIGHNGHTHGCLEGWYGLH